ncbi:hypothetical protein QQP08_001902 [Theobroma cacao]|nr:hypothetical protein QQP08_001902 [Theobroma cacao]
MGSRTLSIGASLDSPDAPFERNHTENVSMVSLKFHESNGVLDQGHQVSSPVRRDVVSRSLSAVKVHEKDEMDLESGKLEKDRDKTIRSNKIVKIQNQALLSGLAYCISSCSMILVNKFVLSSYDFNAGISLMLYQLTLRRVMDTAKQVTKSGNLNEFSMVLLNNTLSLPLGILLIFVFREVDYLCTTLVGSLNKIPLSVAGIVLFKVPTSLENSASIFFGLLAGVFFARAKMRERS